MAKAETTEIDELAFRLYVERISNLPAHSSGDAAGAWAYRKAEEFVAVRDRVKAGDVTVTATSRLSDASAPNLKHTHPHNLVSQRFAERNGGEEKVLAEINRINKWLLSHPHSDDSPPTYDALDWDVPTTKLARVLMPHYATN